MKKYNVDKCDTCSKEDHEGNFCRCENRNIAIAKELRSQGKSPWDKKEVYCLQCCDEIVKESLISMAEFLIEENHREYEYEFAERCILNGINYLKEQRKAFPF